MRYFYFILVLCFVVPYTVVAQGLQFYDNTQPIDNRTSFQVFTTPKTSYTDYFEISFNLSTYKGGMGYIFRVKSADASKIYNLFYDGRDLNNNAILKLNEEGKSNILTASISQNDILYPKWTKLSVKFSLAENSISLSVNDSTQVLEYANLPKRYVPDITFGKSEYMIDVPPMILANLSVGNTVKEYFPLDEHEDDEVHNAEGNAIGSVSNPIWFINFSYNWQHKTDFSSPSQAGSIYDVKNHKLYYFNQDWLDVFDAKANTKEHITFKEKCPVQLVLASCFIDYEDNRLYVYEPFYNIEYDGPTVASLDLETYEWQIESYDRVQKEIHHHSYFFDNDKKQYIIFGGYGNMLYSNNFFSYDLKKKTWQSIDSVGGNRIFPRYFSSIGYQEDRKAVYLFGGMGNESGEHIVGRKYFYDLYRINWQTKDAVKLWQVPWKSDNIVPARGLALHDNHFYMLAYPEHLTESSLQLYRFSIKTGAYEMLGDTISIYSDRISTRANLYHDEELEKLFAVIQESSDDVESKLKIYSIHFPPLAKQALTVYQDDIKKPYKAYIIIAILLIGASAGCLFWLYKRRIAKKQVMLISDIISAKEIVVETQPNAIYLFGEFAVYDRNKKDITYLFSEQLKQTLCLLLEGDINKGISSQELTHLLWPDKVGDRAKNSRGVTINNLRKALSDLDGIELIYEKGYFKFVLEEPFYCDYLVCNEMMNQKEAEADSDLISIVSRGKFLKYAEDPIYDSFKSHVEQKLEPKLIMMLETSYEAANYVRSLNIAEALFNIDPINNEALATKIKILVRHNQKVEAKETYQRFVQKYKLFMGADYQISYKDIIESK